ncbi:MAG: S1 RNA-binding domain-containing protein, partial [Erysipelotrichaceae bacterium]|nr:S1 RNA-binding domain-containing protein [Erysipelotrichaceae bacterium]
VGTKKGICALQMDIKIDGITKEILEEALAQAKVGRAQIMEVMTNAISQPREDVSEYAPKIYQMKIEPDQIREVIGSGGKTINEIIEKSDNVKIDIEQDGRVVIYHSNKASIMKAVALIEKIVRKAEVGEIYEAKVTRIEKYGAFVELFEGTEALLHVSKICHERIDTPNQVLKLGDIVRVKVTEIDEKGRVNVSRKVLLPRPERSFKGKEDQAEQPNE